MFRENAHSAQDDDRQTWDAPKEQQAQIKELKKQYGDSVKAPQEIKAQREALRQWEAKR